MRSGLAPSYRRHLAALLAMAALCACEAREPPTQSLATQAWTEKVPDDPGLAGGPRRVAAAQDGFVLLGGPPAGAGAPVKADAGGSGFQMTSGTTGDDMALHSVVYADDAGFAGGPRPGRAVVTWRPAGAPIPTASAPVPLAAPMAAMVLSDMSQSPTASPAAGPADVEADAGDPPSIDFGRAFAFALCLLGAGALWRWRDRLPGKTPLRRAEAMPAE